jgi:hypothetical protein
VGHGSCGTVSSGSADTCNPGPVQRCVSRGHCASTEKQRGINVTDQGRRPCNKTWSRRDKSSLKRHCHYRGSDALFTSRELESANQMNLTNSQNLAIFRNQGKRSILPAKMKVMAAASTIVSLGVVLVVGCAPMASAAALEARLQLAYDETPCLAGLLTNLEHSVKCRYLRQNDRQ